MRNKIWNRKIIKRYTLFQIPGLIIIILLLIMSYYWSGLPTWLMWTLLGVWLVKDVFLYPYLWRAYDPDTIPVENSMVGLTGVAMERLDPEGYVEVGGEVWKARTDKTSHIIEKGSKIKILSENGLLLVVKKVR
jgi:membrane protein implicated in regulation of membrane protease activity